MLIIKLVEFIMNKFYQLILILILSFIVFSFVQFSEANTNLHVSRQRRYLGFRNISHFFVRLNFKANMVPFTQIFAQAFGFRMNWDEPPDSFRPYHHLSRRAVYKSIEILLNKIGLDGFNCIRRAICEIRQIDNPNEIYIRILKIVFRQISSETEKWHNVTAGDCDSLNDMCPFSMLEVSQYTDD